MDDKTENVEERHEQDILAKSLEEFFIKRKKANVVPLPDEQDGAASVSDESREQFLTFRLSDEMFAVSIMDISEIIKPATFTEVPRTKASLLGVLSLRGLIVPVLDLRLLLGLDELPQTKASRVLIVTKHDEKIGLLVDQVSHVIRLHDKDIEPPGAFLGKSESDHIMGFGRLDGQMFTLLELDSLVDLEKYIDFQEKGKQK